MSRPALTSAEAFSSVFESAAPRAKPSITLAIALASETALSSRSDRGRCGICLARVALFLGSRMRVDCWWVRPGRNVVTCGVRQGGSCWYGGSVARSRDPLRLRAGSRSY